MHWMIFHGEVFPGGKHGKHGKHPALSTLFGGEK